MKARTFCAIVAVAFSIAPFAAHTQSAIHYPAKPIKLIVSSSPGGPPDLVARLLGEALSKNLGQPVVVENRTGAIGTIGMNTVAKAPADGYTIGLLDFTHMVGPSLIAKLPYDTEKDLAAVTLFARPLNLLVVPSGSPTKSVAELIAAAKAKPGFLKLSSGGNGSPAHLIGELFKREVGVDIAHIPYKGPVAGANALLAGDVDMMFGAPSALSPLIKSGKLHPLATPAPRRIAAYPDVPTLLELGYAGVAVASGNGVVAPARTPKEVVARLHAEIQKIGAMHETKQRLEALGMESADASPEEFSAHSLGLSMATLGIEETPCHRYNSEARRLPIRTEGARYLSSSCTQVPAPAGSGTRPLTSLTRNTQRSLPTYGVLEAPNRGVVNLI